jgi:FkbM family methyltransferase
MHITLAKLKELFIRGTVNGNPVHRYALAKLVLKSHAPAFLTFSTGDYRLWLHPSELSYQLYQDRAYYSEDQAIMRGLLRPGDIVVDVGANVGPWTLYSAGLVGPSGHVYAIEPHPQIAGYLTRNIELNGFTNVTVLPCAAGEAVGTGMLEERINDANNNIADNGTMAVPVAPLDELIPARPIRLIKIDAEGSELQVLRGARKALTSAQHVYIECWDSYFRKRGYSTADLLSILRLHGFTIEIPDDHGPEFHENVLAHK